MNILRHILVAYIICTINIFVFSACFANYNQILHYKKMDGNLLPLVTPTIKYLDECHNSKIDWTTSLPIKSLLKKARIAGINSFFYDDIHTYYNGMLNENILDLIAKYFEAKNIKCNKKDIKIRYTAFDILRDFYSMLEPNNNHMLIVAPTFGYYIYQAAEYNIKTSMVFTKKENGWKITPHELEKAIQSSKANIFLLTNPVNPTGVFYSKNELEGLAKIIIKYNIFVISDEIFSDIYFKSKPYSIAAINGMQKRTLTLSGLGKARGVRLSFACCPIQQIPILPTSGILKPIQAAAVVVLKDSEINKQFLANSIKEYKTRIQFIKVKIVFMNNVLNKHYKTKNITYVKPFIIPKSTNIFLISFPGFLGKTIGLRNKINTSLDMAKYLYRTCGVATVPGEGFLIDANEMALRIPMSVPRDELKNGLNLILKALKGI